MHSQSEWLESMRIAGFSDEQQRALERIRDRIAADEAASARFEQDYQRSLQPGDDALNPVNQDWFADFLGDDAGMYPAYVIAAGIGQLRRRYRQAGIPERYLTDAMGDLSLWVRNSERITGRMELRHYPWMTGYVRMELFRIGRLEFIAGRSEVPAHFFRSAAGAVCALMAEGRPIAADGRSSDEARGIPTAFTTEFTRTDDGVRGNPCDPLGVVSPNPVFLDAAEWTCVLSPGDSIIEVHIPEGPPMDPDEISKSLAEAPEFFARYLGKTGFRAFTCFSWLMSPALAEILPGSNLAAFGQRFYRVPETADDWQTFERAFDEKRTDWDDMPCDTALRRGLKRLYLSGGDCRETQGVLLLSHSRA